MTKTREPAVAGIFYASELRQLDSEVEHYLSAEIRPGTARPEILIVPLAGYVYSAPVAAQAYLQLKNYAGRIKNVILVGPSHRMAFKGIAATSADEFKTPLGKVRVNRELTDRIVAANAAVRILDAAHRQEHSLEVQLPFLQKVLDRFKIVPLVYGDVSAEELARVLEPYVTDAGAVIIVSADLSHYFDYDTARVLDGKTAGLIEQNRPEIENHMSCGATGINAALLLAAEKHLRPETLELANSGDTVGDRDSVVGYGAWSFAPNRSRLYRPAGWRLSLKTCAASLLFMAGTYIRLPAALSAKPQNTGGVLNLRAAIGRTSCLTKGPLL